MFFILLFIGFFVLMAIWDKLDSTTPEEAGRELDEWFKRRNDEAARELEKKKKPKTEKQINREKYGLVLDGIYESISGAAEDNRNRSYENCEESIDDYLNSGFDDYDTYSVMKDVCREQQRLSARRLKEYKEDLEKLKQLDRNLPLPKYFTDKYAYCLKNLRDWTV